MCYYTFMDKKEEKEVEYLFAHLNRLWTGLLVLIGGLSGLLLTYSCSLPPYDPSNEIKILLLLLGAFMLILMLIGLANTSLDIKKRLK